MNHHLEAAEYPDMAKNFSKDIKDGKKYTVLLN